MNNQLPLVSVIMSEYNTDEKLLKESISSILSQTYTNFELILVDDCGKNDVAKIVKEFNDDRIKLYKNKKNSGLVYSLNKAISLSKGKYIARMDTDDFSYENRLSVQVKFMEENPQYDVIGTNAYNYDGEKIWGETSGYGKVSRDDILKGCPLIHPSVMYKKEVIDSIGGYLNYNRCEDYATWIEMFYRGYKMYVLNEKLIRYHFSLDDYKKRTLKTRKDFFKMIKEEYIKLHPSQVQLLLVFVKNFIAGILPYKVMYIYHKNRMRGKKYDS